MFTRRFLFLFSSIVRLIAHSIGAVCGTFTKAYLRQHATRNVLKGWLTLFLFALAIDSLPGHRYVYAEDVPQSLAALWEGFEELDRSTPLDEEVLKEWEEGGIVCSVVRFRVGVFKGESSWVAGFYGYPKGGTKLPALLSLHGGGQSAGLDSVLVDAKRGYASLSLNWGGNKLNFGRSSATYEGPQTDWGRLDATHPPQRNKSNHFAGPLAPDEFTIDGVESPRNSNWFVVLMAARRSLSFLQAQPEVDPDRLGVYGHSMGGKLTTNLAGIDKRVKAAVPSCGGAGHVLESQQGLAGCVKTNPTEMQIECISDNAYLPLIECPILWLSPTNDFHAPIGNMAWNWRDLPDQQVRFSISPHHNHRHADECEMTRHLWFEEHLKRAFEMPESPKVSMLPEKGSGVPCIQIDVDRSLPVEQVRIYYSVDPHELTRFWRSAVVERDGDQWAAECPIMSIDRPLFVFANVEYSLPATFQSKEQAAEPKTQESFVISSRVLSLSPAQLRAAGVVATDAHEMMIDDGSRGWQDWYQLNWGHPPLWMAVTRKLKDEKWVGPDHAELVFEVTSWTDNKLVVQIQCNAWGAFHPSKPSIDYAVVKELKGGKESQTVRVRLDELLTLGSESPESPKSLADWRTVTELSISPSGSVVKDGMLEKVNAPHWQGPREIHHLRWEVK